LCHNKSLLVKIEFLGFGFQRPNRKEGKKRKRGKKKKEKKRVAKCCSVIQCVVLKILLWLSFCFSLALSL